MKYFWRICYSIFFVLMIWEGYGSLSPQRTAGSNADWYFVLASFVGTILFPLGAMFFARSRGVKIFYKPSFDRHPLGWWNDTLQPIRISLIFSVCQVLGCLPTLRYANELGFMTFYWMLALTIGLFIGERLVYLVYKSSIA
jgi:hypothetical protein